MPDPLFAKILVPVDFSPCSEQAFCTAMRLARQFQAGVVLMHVVDTRALDALNALGLARPSEEAGQKKRLRHVARLQLRRLERSDEAKGLGVTRVLAEGAPFVEIARIARREKVDLVVIGSSGGQTGQVEKIFFGSTAEKVVRTAGCPVLCVPLADRLARPAKEAS